MGGSHTLELQRQRLLTRFLKSSARISRETLVWRGTLQPSPISREYSAKLTYKRGGTPRVFIRYPQIEERDGKKPEHLYSDGSLCLFTPNAGEWTGAMLLADTTVPWACEWLFHYEIWLVTGTWTGGGEHPSAA